MSVIYDNTELAAEADEKIRTFQADAAKRAGIFHHLITLPTYHTAALSTDNLAKEYFGRAGMLGYVLNVQRQEIRQGIACVKHQNMSGSDIGDDHNEYFRSEEHTSELQSLMRNSYAVFCLKKKTTKTHKQ